jgi:uncharacterized membrane protein YfcA
VAGNPITRRFLSRSALVLLAFALWLGLVVGFLSFGMHIAPTAAMFLLRLHLNPFAVIIATQAFSAMMMVVVASHKAKKARLQKATRVPKRTYPLGLN